MTLVLLLLGASAQTGAAAEVADGWMHQQWTTADGLPVNIINDIAQDGDGYLWLATFDGLVRFDGVRFSVFSSTTHPELPSNRFTTVTVLADGSLWLSSEQHHLIRFQAGRFTTFDSDVVAIVPAADGSLLVGTGRGLARYQHGEMRPVLPDRIRTRVYAIVQAADGGLWIGTDGGIVHLSDGEVLDRVGAGRGLPPAQVKSLAFVDGTLWIGTTAGVYQWDGELARPVPGAARIADLEVSVITKAGDAVWLAAGVGVYRYHEETLQRTPGAADRYMPLTRPVWAAPTGEIWVNTGWEVSYDGVPVFRSAVPNSRAIQDREGNLWIGADDGLHRLRASRFTVWDTADGLASGNVYPIHQDAHGTFWLGTLGGGVARIHDGEVSNLGEAQGVAPVVWALAEDADGVLWIGGSSLCRLDGDVCVTAGIPSPLVEGEIRAIHLDRDGAMWFGSTSGLYRHAAGQWRRFTTVDGVPRQVVRVFAETADGTLWMGTNGGGIVRGDAAGFQAFTMQDGVCSDVVRALHVDRDGGLWVGTEDRGVCKLAFAQGRLASVVRVGQEHGLHDYAVHRILDDGEGRVWMSGNRGIWWVSTADLAAFVGGERETVDSIVYTERDGLPTSEANGGVHPAGIQATDGRLWFPTQRGAVVIDPQSLPRTLRPPSVHVEQVAIGAGDGRQVFDHGELVGALRLDGARRELEISYSAPTFVAPSNIRFRYRLLGYDDDWILAGDRRAVRYTNLPPGAYRFEVNASDTDGAWSDAYDGFAVDVPARWYETWSVRVAGALLLLLAGLGAGRWRRRGAEQQRALEAQADALRELDAAKSRFFANISHEFRTPLTVILGGLHSDTSQERFDDMRMAMLRNAQRLQGLIDQVRDMHRLEAGHLEVEATPGCVVRYLKQLVASYAPLAERNDIALQFTSEAARCPRLFDADKLEKIVGNLIGNALKFTPKGGAVRVAVACANAVTITVSDDGPGIPADLAPRIFERFVQGESALQGGTGIGLALARELTELQGGTISLDSEPGCGAAFSVCLPLAPAEIPDDGQVRDAPALADASAPDAPASDDDRTTVLVVEDNDDVRGYIRRILDPQYRVIEADRGDDGLRLATESLPDFVICDVMMPGIDGFDLVRRLKDDASTECIPVLMLTARAADTDHARAYDSGADLYLTKPFAPDTLTAAIARVLEERLRLQRKLADGAEPTVTATPAASFEGRARAIIEQRIFDDSFDIDALASALAISRSGLYRELKQAAATSPSALIVAVRLDKARELLEAGEGSVSEVAYAVGFKSLSHFTRSFRARFQLAPSTLTRSGND